MSELIIRVEQSGVACRTPVMAARHHSRSTCDARRVKTKNRETAPFLPRGGILKHNSWYMQTRGGVMRSPNSNKNKAGSVLCGDRLSVHPTTWCYEAHRVGAA